MTEPTLRVLLVEDSEDDALLVERALRKGGYAPRSLRVDTAAAMAQALREQEWDLVLSDFDMPDFSGPAALACLRDSGRDLPFVLVSGKIGEEAAVAMMREGARDYVAKLNLSRLVPVVRRELEEAALRRRQAQTQRLLAASEARYSTIFRAAEISLWEEDFSACYEEFERLRQAGVADLGAHLDRHPDLLPRLAAGIRINDVNPATLRLVGARDRDELLAGLPRIFTPDSYRAFRAELIALWEGHERFETETEHGTLDGRSLHVALSMPIPDSVEARRHVPVSIVDLTERKRAEAAIERANRALRTLSASNHALIRVTDEERLLAEVTGLIVKVGGYRMAWVGRCNHANGELEVLSAHGARAEHLAGGAHPCRDPHSPCIAGRAAATGAVQRIADIDAAPAFRRHAAALLDGSRSAIAYPLSVQDRTFGALTIFSAQANGFDERETALLEELASDLAFGLEVLHTRGEHERDRARIQRNLVDTVRALSLAIEKRDPYTAGHQQRAADLARNIALEMGLGPERAEGIYLGGLIHDIGKLYVPVEILSRPARLTDTEFALVKQHPAVGLEIVAGVEFPWPLADMVHQHHERLDGGGYPQGLAGEAIRPEARILAVADVVDAIASDRPYRPALGIDYALAEIAAQRGVRFDAAAVDACLRLFNDKGYRLPDATR